MRELASQRSISHFRSTYLVGVLAIGMACCPATHGMIVGNVPNVVPNTTMNPVDYLGWNQGDPGWNNLTASGSNYVYLGDGWVLSARHVGYNATSGVTLQTMLPDGSPGPVQTFYRIPGSYYHDYGYAQGSTRHYAVSNPTTVQSEGGQTISLQASNGAYFTDLQLFRINGDPGLPALTLSASPLGTDFTRETAPEVVMVGLGQGRREAESHWNVTQVTSDQWTWTPVVGGGTHHGYRHDGIATKRWGTNRLADPRPNGPGDPVDEGAINHTSLFEGIISDTSAVMPLTTGDGVTRRVVSLMTVYDSQSSPGATSLEFQGIGGNSGSGVFFNRDGQWELAGIVNAIVRYPNQPNATIFGNATIISDLSFYTQDYFNSISYIINAHPNYSHIGDINLDGVVAGDGTGPPETDDVTAFLLGWNSNNGLGFGNVESWKMGDLNRDGKTDVHDFLMLRTALNGQISASIVETLFGDPSALDGIVGTVPEPASALLAVWTMAMASIAMRRRVRPIAPSIS